MDLSKMLGDLYQEDEDANSEADTAPQSEGPEWADEARLEEVFSTWTPGPPAEAPEAEHQMAGQGLGADKDLRAELAPDDLGAAIVQGDVSEAVSHRSWSRSDDDVLVGARRGIRNLIRR